MTVIKTPFVITPGDPDGIGPEVVWKTLKSGECRERGVDFLCVGARKPFEKLRARIVEFPRRPAPSEKAIWLLPAPISAPPLESGDPAHLAGYQSGWSIKKATELVLSGGASALVTGPISKERLQAGGFPYPGHTEFLANLCGAGSVTMMLANDTLRVSLVTTHLALKEVSGALTREQIRRAIVHTIEHLRHWWGIAKPKIAVAALNPHAGESGLMGTEEMEIISPEVRQLQRASRGRYTLDGPLPSDTLFAKHLMASRRERYDAVVCMYHDQGLIPVKLLDFPHTVNVTLGLPIIRTSVDHGVGFDIAGTGKADPSSFKSALDLAIRLAGETRKTKKRT